MAGQNTIMPIKTVEFESPAGAAAYPVIKEIAEQRKWHLIYQYSVYETHKEESDWRDWVYLEGGGTGTVPEWIEDQHQAECEGIPCKHVWCSCRCEYEKYRIDFVLMKFGVKVGVEIDGREYHKNAEREIRRDHYLKTTRGFRMLHIMGADAISGKFRLKLKQCLDCALDARRAESGDTQYDADSGGGSVGQPPTGPQKAIKFDVVQPTRIISKEDMDIAEKAESAPNALKTALNGIPDNTKALNVLCQNCGKRFRLVDKGWSL